MLSHRPRRSARSAHRAGPGSACDAAIQTQLHPDIWEAIAESAWTAILSGEESVFEWLPGLVSLACTCHTTHGALQPFLARKREWFVGLRQRASTLVAHAQPAAAETYLELHTFGCRVLFGERNPRTIAALDGLARLKCVLGKEDEAETIVFEAVDACRSLGADARDTMAAEERRAAWEGGAGQGGGAAHATGGLWEHEPARAIPLEERTCALLQLSLSDTIERVRACQGRPEDAKMAAQLRDQCVQRLLGGAPLREKELADADDADRAAAPSTAADAAMAA
eukprot:4887035-Prymnesium_polylepis.2